MCLKFEFLDDHEGVGAEEGRVHDQHSVRVEERQQAQVHRVPYSSHSQ
jgi:hypothetical protein